MSICRLLLHDSVYCSDVLCETKLHIPIFSITNIAHLINQMNLLHLLRRNMLWQNETNENILNIYPTLVSGLPLNLCIYSNLACSSDVAIRHNMLTVVSIWHFFQWGKNLAKPKYFLYQQFYQPLYFIDCRYIESRPNL